MIPKKSRTAKNSSPSTDKSLSFSTISLPLPPMAENISLVFLNRPDFAFSGCKNETSTIEGSDFATNTRL